MANTESPSSGPRQDGVPAPEVKFRFRVPQSLLDSVKDKAKARGIPYTRYIRMLMEQDVAAK